MASLAARAGRNGSWRASRIASGVMAIVVALAWSSVAWAQADFISRAVGGVSIDAHGVVRNAEQDALGELGRKWAESLQQIPGDLNQPSELRKVSLKQLEAAIAQHVNQGTPLPDAVRYLAGLQRIRYVFVYPDAGDIVLAGYGEGWLVDERGNVVGANTRRPVLGLDDLLVALRTAESAAQGGITCSIDPTQAGLERLQSFASSLAAGVNPKTAAAQIEEQLGPQLVTVTGVPADSHFARVLVAADFRMKRLAMNFDPSPVSGLPSFLHMLKGKTSRGMHNMLPRWWLATHYDALLTDGEGLAWELRGPGVKAMTEDDFLAADGSRKQSGKASPVAQKWADNMTARYEELSVKEPIFGELRNCMDLAVIAALLVKENLPARANCSLGILLNGSDLQATSFHSPAQVDTKASFIETKNSYIISASGGVLIDSWGAAGRRESSEALAPLHAEAAQNRGDAWWWN